MAEENPPPQSPVEHAESTSDPLWDLANYLDPVTYFSLLQDHGSTPTAKQAQIMKSKPKSKVPKRIKFADKLFQGLYELGLKLYDHYKLRQELFKQLTDHRSNAVHALGMFIVQRRYSRAKTMVHESTEGEFMSLMNDDRYEHVDMFYFLPQRDVLGFALSKWSGTTLKDKMKYTDDDKIRVVGIALSEDMKDHLKYLLNGSDRKGRLTIDQWRGQQRVE
jgi:predicted DNA-binding protein YlxM (UPF0122 family)